MSEDKYALLIANYLYEHPPLRQLVAPAQDAESLERVLKDSAIGDFKVRTLFNKPSYEVSLAIEKFFDNRKPDDLLLLYFSGHGITSIADRQLFFATLDTQLVHHNVRRATAVSAKFVNEVMSCSRSRRQILVLDCCYSGTFKEGMFPKGDTRADAGEQLQGKGRVVLTASDAFQYSFEGTQVQGEGIRSVFTSALVHGLETGEADLDTDGFFSLDEVYDYVHARVSDQQPEQKPMKMGYIEGKILIANNPRPRAGELPLDLRETLQDRRRWVRRGAVLELKELLASSNRGQVLAAQAALSSLAKEDDSDQIRREAASCLTAPLARAKKDTEQEILAREKVEQKRLAEEQAEVERQAAEADRIARKRAKKERPEHVQQETVAKVKARLRAAEKASAELVAKQQAEAHVNLGCAREGKGDFDGAIAEYRKAIKLKPDYAVAHYNLGNMLSFKLDFDGAIAEYRKAIKLKPDFAYAHSGLGCRLDDKGDFDGAIAEYRKAIKLKPDYAEAHYNLGIALEKKGDFRGALKEFRRGGDLKPSDPHYRVAVERVSKKLSRKRL